MRYLPVSLDPTARHQGHMIHLKTLSKHSSLYLPSNSPAQTSANLPEEHRAQQTIIARYNLSRLDLNLAEQFRASSKKGILLRKYLASQPQRTCFRKSADNAEKCSNLKGVKLDSKSIYLLSENDS